MNATAIITKLLKLSEITIDAGTQIRTAINDATVSDYAERMADGDTFPNPHVYFDGSRYILADGFHRFMAAARTGVETIRCEVHQGTVDDARRFALSANGANGLRMTNEDKRNAVKWGLELFPSKSSRELAKICYVSHNFVETCRKQLSSNDSSPRTGADGVERKMPVKQPKQVVGSVENQVSIPPVQPETVQPSQPAALKGINFDKVDKLDDAPESESLESIVAHIKRLETQITRSDLDGDDLILISGELLRIAKLIKKIGEQRKIEGVLSC